MTEPDNKPKEELEPKATQAPASTQAQTQQPAAKKSTSGLAVAGLVLGLIALLSCWIPLFNVLTTPFAILGLVFAIIGIVATAPAKPKGGRGIAIAGTVLCAISLVVFMAMYGGAAAVSGSNAENSSSTEASTQAQSSDSTDDDSNDAADESKDADEASEDAGIVIKGCKAGKDYDGNKVACITIEWTNNTGDTAAFFTEYAETAYVDGEEVDRATMLEDGWYEDQTKIKPGKTKTIKFAYDWDGKSDVEFEVTKFLSSDPIVSQTLKVK